MLYLESTKNARVKHIISLEKARERKHTGLFLIEGIRELNLAITNGYEMDSIFFCADFLPLEALDQQLAPCNAEKIQVSREVADKIFYRKGIANVLGIAKAKTLRITDLALNTNPLLLVIEKVEKPGNLGAMLRTADAAGIDGVIICDAATDAYNPNVVRSSLGCIFSVPVAIASSEETIQFLHQNKINTFAAHLEAKHFHFNSNFTHASAIVVGSEAEGLSTLWENAATERIKIPMLGQHDSMNVSNAAAVLLYEAVRQRMK